jgi:Fur family peroxide stress response transcriptional regulator
MKNEYRKANAKLDWKVEKFKAECRRLGLKITPQRTAIYIALAAAKDHPTADALHRRLRKKYPEISLDTVNRTLLTLADIGLAIVVEGTGQPKRFDADIDTHQHFICVKCKKIFDFKHKPFENIRIPKKIERKFKIIRTTVYIEGFCDACLKKTGR